MGCERMKCFRSLVIIFVPTNKIESGNLGISFYLLNPVDVFQVYGFKSTSVWMLMYPEVLLTYFLLFCFAYLDCLLGHIFLMNLPWCSSHDSSVILLLRYVLSLDASFEMSVFICFHFLQAVHHYGYRCHSVCIITRQEGR